MRIDFHLEACAGLTERQTPSALKSLLVIYFSFWLRCDKLPHAQHLTAVSCCRPLDKTVSSSIGKKKKGVLFSGVSSTEAA